MAANQLLVDGVERIADSEEILLIGHLRIEYRLQHEIAQLFGEARIIAPVDGIDHLIGLFKRVWLDGVEGLFAVPRTAIGCAQALHDLDQSLKFRPGGSGVFHCLEGVFSG